MPTSIKMTLSTESIEKAIKEIKAYKKSLGRKCTDFVSKLADCGIRVAIENGGKYGNYITFDKKVVKGNAGSYAVMFGSSVDVWEYWLDAQGVQGAKISPILMAEFGSGSEASDAANLPNSDIAHELGMGQGTFFDQGEYLHQPSRNHAFDDVWYWMDVTGEWHSSSGEEPTMPMFKAAMEMKLQIKAIAKEVFGS